MGVGFDITERKQAEDALASSQESLASIINSVADGSEHIDNQGLNTLQELFGTFIFEILGLKNETTGNADDMLTDKLMKIIIDLRQDAKNNKDWKASDKIRNDLKNAGIILNDLKEGADWEKV